MEMGNDSMAIGKPQMYYSDDHLQWNSMVIKAEGWHTKAWLNGVLVTIFNGEEYSTIKIMC
jgi:hypothetical protein